MVIFCVISCAKKADAPEDIILGNWVAIDTTNKPWHRDMRGFEFYPYGVCDNKVGFWDWHSYEKDTITPRDEKFARALGSITKYIITKDSLKIYDLTEKKWDGYAIDKFKGDSLVLKKDSVYSTFLRKHYDISKVPDFDAVIVSSFICYGSCPASEIMISKNGDVLYKGNHFVAKKGWYTSTISDSILNRITRRFKQADYINLKNDYHTIVSDSRRVTVSFIKNGRIFKTIEDYADSAPKEFVWAYDNLVYLNQFLDLKPKAIDTSLDCTSLYSSFRTMNKVMGMEMPESEGFYLVSLLMDAKTVTTPFDEKYEWSYDTDAIPKITTDGRLYKLYYKNGKTEIKDIGFNFITDNKLKNKIEIIKY